MALAHMLAVDTKDPNRPLGRLERMFVSEFMKDLNGAEAYRRVRPNCKRPKSTASSFLKRANVQAAIERLTVEREERNKVTVERLEKRYAEFAFGQFSGPVFAGHVLQALEALSKMKGAFKPEVSVNVPVSFVISGLDAPSPKTDGQTDSASPVLELIAKPEPKGS